MFNKENFKKELMNNFSLEEKSDILALDSLDLELIKVVISKEDDLIKSLSRVVEYNDLFETIDKNDLMRRISRIDEILNIASETYKEKLQQCSLDEVLNAAVLYFMERNIKKYEKDYKVDSAYIKGMDDNIGIAELISEMHEQVYDFSEVLDILSNGIGISSEEYECFGEISSDFEDLEFESLLDGNIYLMNNGILSVKQFDNIQPLTAITERVLCSEYRFTSKCIDSIIKYLTDTNNTKNKNNKDIIDGGEALSRILKGEKLKFIVEMFGKSYTGFLSIKNGIPSYSIDNIEDILGSSEGIILGALTVGKWFK